MNMRLAVKSLKLFVCILAAACCLPAPKSKSDEPGKDTKPAAVDSTVGNEPGQVRDDNGLKMKLVWCPPGNFTMGSPASEQHRDDDENQVSVTLTNGFWLGKYEVTQRQWKQVMRTSPWTENGKARENVKEGADYPATYVSWKDAIEFLDVLTQQERAAGRLPEGEKFTLPTEAQWEYACRAGAKVATPYSFGSDESALSEYAWWGGLNGDGNAKDEPYAHRVGQKKPNAWGLHDIHGNVWEWCLDAYAEQLPGGTDPIITAGDSGSVQRGGSWFGVHLYCRTALRFRRSSDFRFSYLGFRVARISSK